MVAAQASTTIDSNVSTTTTWDLQGSPYIIVGDIEIRGTGDPVLTIEEGVEVRFSAGASLRVGSTSVTTDAGLTVAGSAQNPVLFTSDSATPAPGDWNCLGSNSKVLNISFDYAIFEYGGSGGIGLFDVNGGNPQFSNCVFRHSDSYGIHHSATDVSAIVTDCEFANNGSYPLHFNAQFAELIGAGNSFSGNAIQRILLYSSSSSSDAISESQTWLDQGIPYELEDDLIIRTGDDPLVLEPGVELLFRSGKSLSVSYGTSTTTRGSIAAEEVIFAAVDPLTGWLGINVPYQSTYSELVSCTVRDVSDAAQGAISLFNISNEFLIDGCSFSDNDTYAIYCAEGANITVSDTSLQDNAGTISLHPKDMHKLLSGNSYQDNTDNRIHCRGGVFGEQANWVNQGIPILVLASLEYRGGGSPTLTITYGTVLEFAEATSFAIGSSSSSTSTGRVLASGVTFRGETAEAGYWTGLVFNNWGRDCVLSGCTIRDAGNGAVPAVQIVPQDCTITGSTISNCDDIGIYMAANSLASLSANIVTQCGSYPLSIGANSLRVLGAENQFTGNDIDRVEVRAEIVSVSGSWSDPNVPYYLTGSIEIRGGSPYPHIQILPGAEVLLPAGASISVGSPSSSGSRGSLGAEGVTFTRSAVGETPAGLVFNQWTEDLYTVFTNCVFEYLNHATHNSAIYANASAPSFAYCVFRNNPGNGIVGTANARPSADNCSFQDNGGYPIVTSALTFDAVSGVGNSFSGNSPDRILISGGIISSDAVWDNPGVPVEVVGASIEVRGGSPYPVLKLNSGLNLLFDASLGLVLGTPSSSSSRGGLQADGATFSALSGIQGGWNGIQLNRWIREDSYLRNCVVEYGGINGNIYLSNAPVAYIEGCISRYGTYGINLTGSLSCPSIIRNYIQNNTERGIHTSASANPVIGNVNNVGDANSFEGNTQGGVWNSTTTLIIDARNNWWGHASGPTHSGNPGGTGDPVSDRVDYLPFRTTNIGDAPASFSLSSPADGSTVETLTPVLDWEEAIDPTPGDTVTYELLIARDAAFSQGLTTVSGLSGTVYTVPSGTLQDDTAYFWKVSATDTQDQATWCNEPYFHFDVAVPEPPAAFSLQSPLPGETVHITSPLLQWQESVDPDPGDVLTYTVYRDVTAAFANPDIIVTTVTQAYSGFCQPGQIYYWKVKAADTTDYETFSATRSFYVDWDAKPRAPVDFTLQAVGSDMVITWDVVPGAEHYDVFHSLLPDQGFAWLGQTLSPGFTHIGVAGGPLGFYYVTSHDVE